jgi:enoyl-CoA hydratase/carnithine racemase
MKSLWNIYQMNYYLGCGALPILSWMNGKVEGSAVGLTLTQFPVSTEITKFSVKQCQQGFFPDSGALYRLSRLPRGLGMYLALTGDVVEGFDVYRAELSSNHCSSDDIVPMARMLSAVKTRYSKNHHHYSYFSENINALEDQDFDDEFHGDGRSELNAKWAMIREVFGSIEDRLHQDVLSRYKHEADVDLIPEMMKDLAKQQRYFRPYHEEDCVGHILDTLEGAASADLYDGYAQKALDMLKSASPFSLNLTYEMMRNIQFKYMSLAEVLQQDYRVACRLLWRSDSDFYRGFLDRKWKDSDARSVNVEQLKKEFLEPFSEEEANLSDFVKELDFPEHLKERDMPLYQAIQVSYLVSSTICIPVLVTYIIPPPNYR